MGYKTNDRLNEARAVARTKRKTPLSDIMPEGELAEWLGCSEDTIARYRNEEGLPFIKIGRDVYFSETQVYLWMLSKQVVIEKGEETHRIYRPEKKSQAKVQKSGSTAKEGFWRENKVISAKISTGSKELLR